MRTSLPHFTTGQFAFREATKVAAQMRFNKTARSRRINLVQLTKATKGSGIYNVVIIGGGTAGLVTAAGTAGLGGRVALIERNKMGGDCLNFGCVPSKALISSARLVHDIVHAQEWGLSGQTPRFDLQQVLARMRARRTQVAPNDSEERFASLGVDVFRGDARFLSPNEVVVNGNRLRARNFVIATGTRPKLPGIEGLGRVPYFTNETIFDQLTDTPESMIVIGGGPIGCELSQAFSRLGVRVTLINQGSQILAKEDPDIAAFAQTKLEADGVTVLNKAKVSSCAKTGDKVELRLKGNEEALLADTLMVCAGRTPNVEDLDLKAAKVACSKRGIETNAYLQTTQSHIYAIGDVVGPYQFTHMADYQARIVVRNILMPFAFLRQKVDYSVVPWCTFVHPEVARVGLSEKEANESNISYTTVTQQLAHVDRAVLENEEAGFVKVLVKKGTDKILGVTIVAEHAGELIHEFILAMKHEIGLSKIARAIHVYPTLSEIARKAGDQYNKTRLTPFARKLFSWLYRRARS